MATIKDSATTLRIRVATGVDAEGKTTFANRTMSDINPSISNDDFVLVGAGYASLQSHELASIIREDKNTFEVEG